jgi:hypothetical protein
MSQGFVNPQTITLPLPVSDGGTGATSATAYAVQCGGTTSTGAHQSIASVGTSGQVLTSNGAGALPTFQTLQQGNVVAWIYFDGSTASPTTKGSGNVTSITDNGTGDYTINFTNALTDANYSCTTGIRYQTASALAVAEIRQVNSSSCRLTSTSTSGVAIDSQFIDIIVVR